MAALAGHATALAGASAAGLEAAGQAFEALGASLLAAEAYLAAAASYRAGGQSRSATAMSRRAAELAMTCGDARTPGLSPGATAWRLTRREQEIATMVAAGASSRDIAGRLVLSVRTVDNHLQNIYGKLGVTRRDELRPRPGRLIRPPARAALARPAPPWPRGGGGAGSARCSRWAGRRRRK